MNGYEQKKGDMWRLYGMCGMCKQDKFFIKRVEIKLPTGLHVISPSHFCKKCAIIIKSKLTPKQDA